MIDSQTSHALPQGFPPTRWSVVLSARQEPSLESAAALETICRTYWYPLYAYVRRCGHSPHDAEDVTQAFFCRLLEKKWLNQADKEKGRLRTYLITALKRFMVSEWRRASAQRRGSGHLHLQIDTTLAESRYAAEVRLLPEEAFDKEWALTLNDLTLDRLEKEFLAAAKMGEFEALKDTLMAARGTINYAAIASKLSTSEGAVRVAVHRLRKRFREIYREEISQTLSEAADIEAELRHLAHALASS